MESLPLPAWVSPRTGFGIYLEWELGTGICHDSRNLCPLALQRDPVDAGERGAAALLKPQTPKHGETAEVVQSMERERQVSTTVLNG